MSTITEINEIPQRICNNITLWGFICSAFYIRPYVDSISELSTRTKPSYIDEHHLTGKFSFTIGLFVVLCDTFLKKTSIAYPALFECGILYSPSQQIRACCNLWSRFRFRRSLLLFASWMTRCCFNVSLIETSSINIDMVECACGCVLCWPQCLNVLLHFRLYFNGLWNSNPGLL